MGDGCLDGVGVSDGGMNACVCDVVGDVVCDVMCDVMCDVVYDVVCDVVCDVVDYSVSCGEGCGCGDFRMFWGFDSLRTNGWMDVQNEWALVIVESLLQLKTRNKYYFL